ncbi:MAG: hypothetical protein KDC98_09155 [Planctomycetes bacterium]|nr:hypothetical protein [Planctomycetota bacterium]
MVYHQGRVLRFIDDGHPEASDYDNNYIVIGSHREVSPTAARLQAARSWCRRIAAALRSHLPTRALLGRRRQDSLRAQVR